MKTQEEKGEDVMKEGIERQFVVSTLLTKRQLADRWGTSLQTINRLKSEGALPWTDLSLGRRKKPIVRFRLRDIEKLERDNVHEVV